MGYRLREEKNRTNSILLFIVVAILTSLVSLAFSFIAIWPPFDLVSMSVSIMSIALLVGLGVFIINTHPTNANEVTEQKKINNIA
jgi:uncharacterized membrane protein YqjE